MSSLARRYVSPIIVAELDEHELAWEVEPGNGHNKLFVEGQYVGRIHVGKRDQNRRSDLNIRASIRRIARDKPKMAVKPVPRPQVEATIHQIEDYRAPEAAAPVEAAAPARRKYTEDDVRRMTAEAREAVEAGLTLAASVAAARAA